MSLVAYEASSGSDEESDENSVVNIKNTLLEVGTSREKDIFIEAVPNLHKPSLDLPNPKNEIYDTSIGNLFRKLPEPKSHTNPIEEEDDEFLRKKAIPLEKPKSDVSSARKLIRITVPSLKDFDEEEETKESPIHIPVKYDGSSNLISILPTPKSEQNCSKINPQAMESFKSFAFIPETVRCHRPALNTEYVDKMVPAKKYIKKTEPSITPILTDSESSDSESDFFSLNKDEQLPEVNEEEIAALVSKKNAEMAKSSVFQKADIHELIKQENQHPVESHENTKLDKEAIQILIGGQAKRKKMEHIQIIDIDGDQVQPNREEWMRTALASATTYQPTGVLTDEEPAAGTRRKHQITYLAHKAKANEAELQAMWSANRQNRRQTQNKYGF